MAKVLYDRVNSKLRIGDAVFKDIRVTSGDPGSPFYDVHVGKIERAQRRFIRYALRSWTDIYDLPPFEHRCALLTLDTLLKQRPIACIMFLFDKISGRMNSPNLLFAVDLNTPIQYRTRGSKFLQISFHRTNYGVHEPMAVGMRKFNEVISLFYFILTRYQFMNCMKLFL
jgi:hypothetical protein